MSFESQIEQLTESSKSVLQDCVLENGAIVAANSDLPNYPETAVNYRYVWLRDAAFTIYAADVLELSADIKANFMDWLLDRAEDFSSSGTIIKRYATNGRHDLAYGHEYQPDQAGTMLWAIDQTAQQSDTDIDKAAALLATGLSRQWQDTHFSHPDDPRLPIQDLWEDQSIPSGEHSVFTYSLATAISGLELTVTRLRGSVGAISDDWSQAADSMRKVLDTADNQPYYPWKLPAKADERAIDASLDGLIWPFAVGSQTMGLPTIEKIEESLHEPARGIKRFDGDSYDGIDFSASRPDGAGTWPLLGFWHAIALKKSGKAEAANDIYRETLERLPDDYIPEQLLAPGRAERPPAPLAWSHAMFAIATKELGYLG